ncbi:hypothetical protein IMAU10142_02103 [Lactobacillus helveticus]|uniref:Uncharacterized protein n=1 Tax=Lactobacillus helveticus TaxID=1587 RepID=A0A9Q5BZK0_LACHE|nr:hypothetical protein [Lactobacillus helveticus]NRN75738.1 hypothetical protein [Lactobacillus helveticus]NRN78514.1 hypothetical protein [Lactobacillus helveticus]NRN81327.1 hypothetical protein [Lactobacillus helveticus]NRN83565.1 hypothetical protein [Lactobacillus helveticus]
MMVQVDNNYDVIFPIVTMGKNHCSVLFVI